MTLTSPSTPQQQLQQQQQPTNLSHLPKLLRRAPPAFTAILNGNIRKLISIVNTHGPKSVSIEIFNGLQPIHLACYTNQVSCLQYLIQKGADINAKSSNGNSPLFYATLSKNLACVTLLLEKGAHVNIQDKFGFTPLHQATLDGSAKIALLLLVHGAKNIADSVKGITPFHNAVVHSNCVPVVKQLLSEGYSPNSLSTALNTPLLNSPFSNTPEMLKILLKARGNILVENRFGVNIFHNIARCGNYEMFKMAFDSLNDAVPKRDAIRLINKSFQAGMPPLHIACISPGSTLKFIKLLLDSDCSVHSVNSSHQTLHKVLSSFHKQNHPNQSLPNYDEILKLLEDYAKIHRLSTAPHPTDYSLLEHSGASSSNSFDESSSTSSSMGGSSSGRRYKEVVGYLGKLGGGRGGRKNWKKRYFCLVDSNLKYYKSARKVNEIGVISLECAQGRESAISPNHFELATPSRVWVFEAEDVQEKQRWMSAIAYHTKQSKRDLPQTPGQYAELGSKKPSIVLKEGFFKKRGGARGGYKNWRKRWFVLRGWTLSYYSSKSCEKLIDVIDLKKASKVAMKDDDVISLETSTRTWYFKAATQVVTQEWYDLIEAILNHLKSG